MMKNYRLYGNAPYTAAVIHGGPGALGSVAAIARRLTHMGFGVIEPLQTRNSISQLVDELHETLSENGGEQTTLIGHSWGAWLTWLYAAAYPSNVKKLILVGSGPFEAAFVPSIDATRKSRLSVEQAAEMDAIFAALNNPDTLEKDTWIKRFSLLPNTDDFAPVIIETDIEDSIENDGTAIGNILPEAAHMRATGELLDLSKHILCPVIAVHGDYDPHPAEGVQLPLSKKLNNFRFYLLSHCGHSPWKERYAMDEFYEIIANELLEKAYKD